MPVNLDFSQHPSADGERAVKLFISETAHEALRRVAKVTGHSMSFVADAAIRAVEIDDRPDTEPSPVRDIKQDMKTDTKQDMAHDNDNFTGDFT